MNTHPQPGSSGSGTGGPIPAHHPRKVAPMTTRHDSGGDKKLLRILVPINANDDSRWGVQYALRQKREGREVEVILLHVGEPITQWQVLRFRTQQEIAQFQAERAQAFIEEASAALKAADVPCRGLFKQGDVIFSILDTAEETECDEIAMPPPNKGFSGIFSRDFALAVRRRQRDIPVIAVNDYGIDLN
ncbi:MAG: universal stress protein [Sulfuritalea sp.]|nr:universal stress protein [Sulfuritalea sp.]